MTTAALTPREQLRADLRSELQTAEETVESGPMEGRVIVASDEIERIFSLPLTPYSDHAAEVVTPARVVVAAACPKCGQVAEITLQIGAELRVDATGSTLRLQGKSKAASHVCGQTSLAFGDGQTEAFDIEDIVGDGDDDTDVEPAKP